MTPTSILHLFYIHLSGRLRYPADLVWAKHLDKSNRGIKANLLRQQLHILQAGPNLASPIPLALALALALPLPLPLPLPMVSGGDAGT